jgi:hypothetical protein
MVTYPGLRLHLFSDLDGTLADSAQAMSEFLWREWEIELLPQGHADYSFVKTVERRLRETGRCGQLNPAEFAEEIGADIWERLFSDGAEYRRMLPVWEVWSAVRELEFASTRFVTARPAGIGESCVAASRCWLDKWGLLQPDSELIFSREAGVEKADCLQRALRDIKETRKVLGWFGAHGATDVVLVLEDKPEEILSLARAGSAFLRDAEGIRVVVVCVPQPWNAGAPDSRVWTTASDHVFGVRSYYEGINGFWPETRVHRPQSLHVVRDYVHHTLARIVDERQGK